MKITDLTTMILEMPGLAYQPYFPHILRRGSFLMLEEHMEVYL
jgi:hypothetical protein